jgi:DNA-binding transcriptional LysR family regulator
MNTRDLDVFVETAVAGSLAAAARHLGITPMAASRSLASLEQALGVRLVHRSTRSSGLTAEGEEFLPYARSMLELQESACNAIAPDAQGATGILKVTSPHIFGRVVLVPLVQKLLLDNPLLKIEVILSDDIIDIINAGIDIAIRLGVPKDSRLVARQLSPNPRVLCASSSYIDRYGVPSVIEELSQHQCLRMAQTAYWPFMHGEDTQMVRIDGRFLCSSAEGVREACLKGLGIALLSYWDVVDPISSGVLQRIRLLDSEPQNLPIWAVIPTSRHVPLRVRRFLELLSDHLATSEPSEGW